MKKVLFLGMMCVMALTIGVVFSCTEKDNGTNDNESNGNGGTTSPYVDLGLPSGTKWKYNNEYEYVSTKEISLTSYYNYSSIKNFGDKIPTKEQFEELRASCVWSWTGKGYKIVGPSGDSIWLPATGYISCDGGSHREGYEGRYWTSTPNGSGSAWYTCFYPDSLVYMKNYDGCGKYSVRLVQD